MSKIIDTTKLKYSSLREVGYMEIDEEHIYPVKSAYDYKTIDDREIVGMKPVGRLYFDKYKNLDYTDGIPVEKAIVDGGERGMIRKYLKPGVAMYTGEMVKEIIKSRLYENVDDLKPKIPEEVYEFLEDIANNKAKQKPKKAKELLSKYKMVGGENND